MMDFRGDWEEQNEGTTLRIRNNEDDHQEPRRLGDVRFLCIRKQS